MLRVPSSIIRLLDNPIESQTVTLWRTARKDPRRILDWFDYWRDREIEFRKDVLEMGDEAQRAYSQLEGIYRAINGVDPVRIYREGGDTVEKIFDNLSDFTRVVSGKHSNSLLVRGPGGIGKTYTIQDTLDKDETPYVILKGYSAPAAFYNYLHRHRDSLIILDDCDNIFDEKVGLNVLKAVLDTYDTRQVSWNSTTAVVDKKHFTFNGQIIFISNLSLRRLSGHLEALLTRIHVYSMDLTREDMVEKMKYIAGSCTYKKSTEEDRQIVVKFLEEKRDLIPTLNLRHYVKALDLMAFSRDRWGELLLSCL